MEYSLDEKRKMVDTLLYSSYDDEKEANLIKLNINIDSETYKVYKLIEEIGYTEIFFKNPNYCDKMGITPDALKIYSSGKAKEYLNNPSDFTSYNISSMDNVALIILSLSRKEIKSFLEKPIEELKHLNLTGDYIYNLVIQSGFISEFLKRPDLCDFELNPVLLCDMIEMANCSSEFIAKSTEELCKLKLLGSFLAKLINIAGKENDFLAKPIEELRELKLIGFPLVDLMQPAGRENDFLAKPIEELRELELTGDVLAYLIHTARRENDFLAKPIEELRELGLTGNILTDLIHTAKKENDFLTKPIEELRELGLTGHNLIALIGDANIANEFLAKSPKELEDLGLFENDLIMLKLIANYSNSTKKYSSIGLDPSITIGMEIENEETIDGNSEYLIDAERLLHDWQITYDSSLENGCEVSSPILSDNSKSIDEIYLICEYLDRLRATHNK